MADPSFAALRARLDAVPDSGQEPPNVDPRAAALAALMIAEFIAKEPARTRLVRLADTGEFDIGHVADLALAARGMLQLLPKLEATVLPTSIPPPIDVETLDGARELTTAMASAVAASAHEIGEARAIVDYVRLGEGPEEVAQNLRMLAGFYAEYGEILSSTHGRYDAADEARARAVARKITSALQAGDTAELKEWRRWLARAWELFERAYDEVGRAGRFLYHRERPFFRFPLLLSVAATTRRLRTDEEPAPPQAAPASPPRGGDMDFFQDMLDEVGGDEPLRDEPFPSSRKPGAAPVPQQPVAPTIAPHVARATAPEPIGELNLDDLDLDVVPSEPRKGGAPIEPAKPPPVPAKAVPPPVPPKPPPVPTRDAAAAIPKPPPVASGVVPPKPPPGKPPPVPAKPPPPPPAGARSGAVTRERVPSDDGPSADPEVDISSAPPPELEVGLATPPPPAEPAPRQAAVDAPNARASVSDKTRRSAVRFPVRLKLTMGSSDEIGVGATENLSDQGAFIATAIPRASGTRLALIVSHPDTGEVLQIEAMVRWGRPARRGVGLDAGMGVEFVDVTEEQRALIHKMTGG